MNMENEVTSLVNLGYSQRKIAKQLNVSSKTIRYWIDKLGIKLKRSLLSDGSKPPEHIDLVGRTFGYLRIISLNKTKKSIGNIYRAICECTNCNNKKFETSLQAILRGSTTSCGCRKDWYNKMTGKNSSQFTGYEEIGGKLWGRIIDRAKKRNIPIKISIEYAWSIFIKQNRKCALSGLPLTFGISSNRESEANASLDRIDSSKGYIEDNIQWTLKDVNMMKNSLSQERFIELCSKISIFNSIR